MDVGFPNRSVSIVPISLSAGSAVIHSDFRFVEFRWISFFYHNSSQILLLRLHIVVLRPADMGVFIIGHFFKLSLNGCDPWEVSVSDVLVQWTGG